MNREQITPEIVSLAKRLHELGYWKEIQKGDWYLSDRTGITLVTSVESYPIRNFDIWGLVNIPTLTDCLDWLEEKRCPEIAVYARPLGLMKTSHGVEVFQEANWGCTYGDDVKNSYTTAPTPTEAAYLAMLKILGGE